MQRACMYDVYLNGTNDLLVVPKGFPVPSEMTGSWRKKKQTVRVVSDAIRQDVQIRGYHRRQLVRPRVKRDAG